MPYDGLVRTLVNTYDEKTKLFFRLYYDGSDVAKKDYIRYMNIQCSSYDIISLGNRGRHDGVYISDEYFWLSTALCGILPPRIEIAAKPRDMEYKDCVQLYITLMKKIFDSYEKSTCDLFEEHYNNQRRDNESMLDLNLNNMSICDD